MDLARGVGFVGKAAVKCLRIFQPTFCDQLKSTDSDSGSDVSWQDAGSNVATKMQVDFFDASEDQQVSMQNKSKWKLKSVQHRVKSQF